MKSEEIHYFNHTEYVKKTNSNLTKGKRNGLENRCMVSLLESMDENVNEENNWNLIKM